MTIKTNTIIENLKELRKRLIFSSLFFLIIFLALTPFANYIYHLMALPLLKVLPAGTSMIATQVATPITVPLKLTAFASFLISLPYTLYQTWTFIAPGLYKHEKKYISALILSSFILFIAGMGFCYLVVFPVMFVFFAQSLPEGVSSATDIASYFEFSTGMLFSFGISFQVPVIIWLLCFTGVIEPSQIADKRRYMFVFIFIVAAFLTPPDVLSQISLALPLCALFEIGLLATRFFSPRESNQLTIT